MEYSGKMRSRCEHTSVSLAVVYIQKNAETVCAAIDKGNTRTSNEIVCDFMHLLLLKLY